LNYLLDTNVCVYLLNGNSVLEKKVKKIGVYSLAIANVVLAELYFGAYNSKKVKENIKRIELFKNNLLILSDSEESARLFGKIKTDLRSKGIVIEDFDILIASLSFIHNMTLVTNNTDHFLHIDGLKVENWLAK
jgi:tRNA(fMet)-specific endonuclease VapC